MTTVKSIKGSRIFPTNTVMDFLVLNKELKVNSYLYCYFKHIISFYVLDLEDDQIPF